MFESVSEADSETRFFETSDTDSDMRFSETSDTDSDRSSNMDSDTLKRRTQISTNGGPFFTIKVGPMSESVSSILFVS